MLANLSIQNFIIIESIEVSFTDGLNIIIGETGSGKSIIIDALMLLFGEKASADYVRSGSNKAIIEASFHFPLSSNLFQMLEIMEIECETNEIIIRREIPIKGNSRCFINDSPVTLSAMKLFARNLVDFHGQNEQQKILDKENQLEIIDKLLPDINPLANYRKCFNEYSAILKEYNIFINNRDRADERSENLKKLLQEIDEIKPYPDEDIVIDKELKILENAEYLVAATDAVINILDGQTANLSEANKHIKVLLEIDKDFQQYANEFNQAIISINEILKYISNYKGNIEFNPEKIEELRIRYSQLRKLNKKYASLQNAIDKQAEYQNELDLLENYDERLENTEKELNAKKAELTAYAKELTDERKRVAIKFETKIIGELATLGIENANFKVQFTDSHPNITGADSIEYHISANKGEPLAPLANAASGGEISRIMLAIKSLLASADDTPLLIFDEIDTGISGRIAQKVGRNMKGLSKFHQLIAITHLPQIAAMADNMLLIEKQETTDRVIANARIVLENERVTEIAKMLSGENLTSATIESARELMQN